MIEGPVDNETVQYVQFGELQNPGLQAINDQNIKNGFESKDWRKNFDTLTQLRQANRHYANIFLQELFPKFSSHIIQQIDNLRSNNSREALTLVSEIFTVQTLQQVQPTHLGPLVSTLFVKSACEKAFLRNQALKAINILPKKYNVCLIEQFGVQTKSNNGNISELAARILQQYIENNKITDIDAKLLSIVADIANGNRAVLQKKGRQILLYFKKIKGEQKMIQIAEIIRKDDGINEQEFNTVIRQLKKQQKASKPQSNFRQFMKAKKN